MAINRNKIVNLRLAEHVHERLETLADRMGIAPATLASVAVSEYLEAKTRQQEQMRLIAEQMAAGVTDVISNPEFLGELVRSAGDVSGD